MKKLCLYFNIPSRYREEIYTRIDGTYDCEWYFENTDENIKPFDISRLKIVGILNTRKLGGFYWTKGMVRLLRKDYDSFIMIGATRCLSLYVFLIFKNLFFRRKRVLLWTHGYYGKESWTEKHLFKRPLLRLADGLLLYGNYARELMMKDGFNPETILTIHNSLAYTEQLRLRNKMKPTNIYKDYFQNECPVLVFLGRLTRVKQLDMIVDALKRLSDRGECYNLVYVGDGSERSGLEVKVKRLGLQRQVWFYGACYDEAKNAELVYNADVCVAPGNIGLTAIHALMFGCPAITHNDFKWQMPEFEAIHAGATGDFFERNNTKDLADVISRWIRNNASRREEVRQACYREIDEQWNPEFQMKVIEKAINNR